MFEGTAMGSPISPIVANLFMKDFEQKAISTAPHPPYFWKRYVDDTFTILESSHRRAFLDHINSIDQHIQFTCEEQREDGSLPFLDVLVLPKEDGSLSSTVFRKATHTDLYLQWVATTHYHLNIVWLTPYFIELIPSALNPIC